MDKGKLTLGLAFLALALLLLGIPVANYVNYTAGVVMRWAGVAVGVAYFVVRSKARKEES